MTKPLRCYVAGPMRGIPQSNFPAFDAAANELRRRGYEVFNPAENDRACGLNGFETNITKAQFNAMFRWDLARVSESDLIVFLPGWEKSKGAGIERAVAHYLGIMCYDWILEERLWRMIPQEPYEEPTILWQKKSPNTQTLGIGRFFPQDD